MRPRLLPSREHISRDLDLEEQKIVESRINQGMITTIDSADIESGALQYVKNAVVRFDRTKRRVGSTLLLPLKPNNKPVLKLGFIKSQDGSPHTIRMTSSTIHIRGESSWFSINIPSPLLGTTRDRFTTADILDTFIFSNNGANFVQKVDFSTGICSRLGNAPKYRYVFGFFNRAVGLARKDEAECEVGWSADGNPLEWDSNVEPSAGSSPILESPSDLSDFITGGLSFSNIALMFREKSIWHITKQPIQQNPFYFSTAIPGIGCNCPYSIQIAGVGQVAWVDQSTRAVYAYTPGQFPEQISIPIEQNIFADISDPGEVFASYNKLEHEYTIYIPIQGNVVRGYTYNFLTKAWAFNEYLNLTSANDSELDTSGITIDELVGSIDDLGDVTIDSLSGITTTIAARSYGFDNGVISLEDPLVELDRNLDIFETEIRSKTFVMPRYDVNVCRFILEYKTSRACDLVLSYSKDEGSTWITSKTITVSIFNKPQLLKIQRLIRARRFIWRLTCSSGDVELLNYEIYVTPSGESSK